MKWISVLFLFLLGIVIGHQLLPPKVVTVRIREPVNESKPEIPVKAPVPPQIVYKTVIERCDYRPYEETIYQLQEQLATTKTQYRDVVVSVYEPVEVKAKPKDELTLLFNFGRGIKSVDIKSSADGNTVYGDPKKGAIGGIGIVYKFKPFQVPLPLVGPVEVKGLNVGGGIIGAESQYLSVGKTWELPW
ncbi:MAG: hypothetical protein KF802_02760 [Bdellovibrionaceae bacterium]|nr:hypothetical protein [Pseudobdellovibrionaceae bacterium]